MRAFGISQAPCFCVLCRQCVRATSPIALPTFRSSLRMQCVALFVFKCRILRLRLVGWTQSPCKPDALVPNVHFQLYVV